MKYLIAGLGNIGPAYVGTRHNIGFEVLDELARQHEARFEIERYALRTVIKHKGRQLILIKPTTYMNLSGKAVRHWLRQEKLEKENLLVVVDDIAIPFGSIRLKGKGSDGGHNGLKDIQQELQSSVYPRLRFGIGNDFYSGQQIQYVLGKWGQDELDVLPERIDMATKAILSFTSIGLARSMNEFNNK